MTPSLLFSLLLLLLIIVPCYCILDPNSTTLAIIQATGTVCGLPANTQNRSILCTKFSKPDESVASFPIGGTILFDSISGGPNFLCSLRSGDTSFFCWDGIRERIKRVYHGPMALSQISVGSWHIAAIDGDRRNIRWWSYGCIRHALSCDHFPKSVSGEYRSLTSGDGFTCAINGSHSVHCWGPHGNSIQRSFSGIYMDSLTAGGGRMCGLNKTGQIVCTKNHPNVPSGVDCEFNSLAIGLNQTCAIKKDGTVICWGQHGSFFPMGSTRFEFLVSGGNLTCGLTSDALEVSCWGFNERNSSAVVQSLPKVLPGVCVPDEAASCSFGVYPDSWDLCGGSGVICKKSDTSTVESCQHVPPPPAPSRTKWKKFLHTMAKLKYALVGAFIGMILCMFGVFWCIGKRRHKNEANLPDPPEPPDPPELIIQQPHAPLRTIWEKFLLEFLLFGVFMAVLCTFGSELAQLFRWIGRRLPQNVANLVDPGELPDHPELILQEMENVEIFTLDVLRRATNRFSSSVLLGEGCYAKVFLGQLPGRRTVAVKRFNMKHTAQRDNMFKTEVETVYIGRHANVVKLIGYCMQNRERIIVFEHMERNNLSRHLHPRLFQKKSAIFFSWMLRVKILLDVARALQHLQQNAEPRIIHRDIKSTNILIDENWVAKISDFGMALLGPKPGSQYVPVGEPSGTRGYMDPESEAHVTRVYPRFDVYSFGVVILEMLTGRTALAKDGTMMVDSVIPRIQSGDFNEVRDKRLNAPIGSEVHALQSVVEIAQQCVSMSYRTDINNVVTVLETALTLCHQAAAPAPA